MRKNQNAATEVPRKGSITTIETRKQEAPAIVAPAPQSQVPDRPYDPQSGKVRLIGPQFLAGDRGEIDLKNPATPGAQPQQR
jgi:hypothetical protein